MPIETPKSAGDDVESRCLKCKTVTSHTIIAMTGGLIAKCQCNTCSARHNYRPPITEKTKSPTTLRRRYGKITTSGNKAPGRTSESVAAKKATRSELNFATLLRGRGIEKSSPYAINISLKVDDVVSHSIFGLGVVTDIILPNKAQITFQEQGPKILICNPG